MNKNYTEILRLKKMLEEADIPYEYREYLNGCQIHFHYDMKDGWSVIENDISYGREKNLLEISGSIMTDEEKEREDDTVLGFLTAEDVFRRIADFMKWGNKKNGI